MAAQYCPGLDAGLVAQFSLVHDLQEIYKGDIWTFDISQEDLEIKRAAEKEAVARLLSELPSYTAELLARYEEQVEPEARFVRCVDKLMPAIIMIHSGEASTFKEDYGIKSADDILKNRKTRTDRLRNMYPEFDFIHILRDTVSKTSVKQLFPDE